MRRYDNQIAVITGAASGIGRQLAEDLVARGATVWGVDMDEPALKQVPGLEPYSCDVSDLDAYKQLLTDVEATSGRIDILANIAGIDRPVSALSGEIELYRSVLQVNFLAPLVGTLAVLPGMVERRHGYVINVSSDSVRSPIAGASAYIASKGAISGFSESSALELKTSGVHIHVLYPGFVYSAMGRAAIETGMKPPPKMAVRTPEQVSAVTLERLGGTHIDINAAPLTLFTPILKTLTPRLYRRIMVSRSMPFTS
jgi:NAD(P)-dependent dehydrogenase (short-subunit alcohol dehydrogenase family)